MEETCTDCRDAKTHGTTRLFNPACLRCGGRYLRAIQRLPMDPEPKRAWLRKALTDWMAHGHPEQALRDLAAKKPTKGTEP